MSPDVDPELTVHSVVVAAREQVSSDLAGETIVLSLRSGMYYGLDQVGARVWELLREPVRVADICAAIAREYEVGPDGCERDVLHLVRDLATHGLIEIRDGAETG